MCALNRYWSPMVSSGVANAISVTSKPLKNVIWRARGTSAAPRKRSRYGPAHSTYSTNTPTTPATTLAGGVSLTRSTRPLPVVRQGVLAEQEHQRGDHRASHSQAEAEH